MHGTSSAECVRERTWVELCVAITDGHHFQEFVNTLTGVFLQDFLELFQQVIIFAWPLPAFR